MVDKYKKFNSFFFGSIAYTLILFYHTANKLYFHPI